jgi:hypothetical protein
MESTISNQLENVGTLTLNSTVGHILWWGLLVVGVLGVLLGLFGPAVKSFFSTSTRRSTETGRLKTFVGVCLRVLSIVVGLASAAGFIGALHTMEFVGTNQIAVSEEGALEQGAYIIPSWNPEPRFLIERSGSFTRDVSGQIDPETGSRVDLNLTWEYRVRDADKASALYPLLRTHGTVEGYADWELASIVKNPNSLDGLQEAVTSVCKTLDDCGVELRAQAREVHTQWRQYDASGVRIAEQNEQPEAQY